MALNNVFATAPGGSQIPLVQLDQNFNAVGAMGITQCTATGTNSIVLTPFNNQPSVNNPPQNLQRFSFIAAGTSTGSVTVQIAGGGIFNLYLPGGAVQVGANGVALNSAYDIMFVSSLNNGAGGFVIISQTSGGLLVPRDYLAGLTLSNDSGNPNTVLDISQGVAVDDTQALAMTLTVAGYGKSTAAWAFGSGNGALDTGTIAANTWYHVFLIGQANGTVDALFSTSVSAPTMPNGFTFKRRLGSVKTNASAQLIPFTQFGDYFWWNSPTNDDISTVLTGATPINGTVNCPPGVQVLANWQAAAFNSSSNTSGNVRIYNPSFTDFVPTSTTGGPTLGFTDNASATTIVRLQASGWTLTNTSQQLRFESDATCSFALRVIGWLDTRGRFN